MLAIVSHTSSRPLADNGKYIGLYFQQAVKFYQPEAALIGDKARGDRIDIEILQNIMAWYPLLLGLGTRMRDPNLCLYYTLLYYAVLYIVLYYTILYYTILYYTILYYTILYYTIQYNSILYHTMLYYTLPYHTIPYHTIPYRSLLGL